MDGLVRARKESDRARGTHSLETAEEGTYQNMKRKRPSEGRSLSGGRRGRSCQDTT
jgi:hypothetical protein